MLEAVDRVLFPPPLVRRTGWPTVPGLRGGAPPKPSLPITSRGAMLVAKGLAKKDKEPDPDQVQPAPNHVQPEGEEDDDGSLPDQEEISAAEKRVGIWMMENEATRVKRKLFGYHHHQQAGLPLLAGPAALPGGSRTQAPQTSQAVQDYPLGPAIKKMKRLETSSPSSPAMSGRSSLLPAL